MIDNRSFMYFEPNITNETLYRRNDIIRKNRGYAHLLLNTFPTERLNNEIERIVYGDSIEVSEWLIIRILCISRFEYDRYEDMANDKESQRTMLTTVTNINHGVNFKLYSLYYTMKVLSVFLSSAYFGGCNSDKERQDKLIAQLFYDLVNRLDCTEILDEVIDKILGCVNDDDIESNYNNVLEYNIISHFINEPLYNPYITDLKSRLGKSISYDKYDVIFYKELIYKCYNKYYNTYMSLIKFKNKLNIELGYYNLNEKFEDIIFKFTLENFEDLTLNDIALGLVKYYDGYREERFVNALFNTLKDKYKYVGKVYHGSRNTTDHNKSIDSMLNSYNEGLISSSKKVKGALAFAKFNNYDREKLSNSTTQYGFISEIEITEDMEAVDIHKLLLELKEKLPDLTEWINDSFINEYEVLIPAVYIKNGKVLSCAEAEEIVE